MLPQHYLKILDIGNLRKDGKDTLTVFGVYTDNEFMENCAYL